MNAPSKNAAGEVKDSWTSRSIESSFNRKARPRACAMAKCQGNLGDSNGPHPSRVR
jgi:hypothetical protein